ncbi:AraC family transcriptional regulator [Zavarzinia sp. CC-PAN008]|uniref:AraC family transcriptional regulator n=1 Tax=Zavarzinia sp. CC-PAN008 TaxID=3243332 RepID=UPI003F7426B1
MPKSPAKSLPIVPRLEEYARAPDVRMDGVRFDLVQLAPPFHVDVIDTSASLFYYVRSGEAWFGGQPASAAPRHLPPGTAMAMERGVRHSWSSAPQRPFAVPDGEMPRVPFGTPCPAGAVELIMGRIERHTAALMGGNDAFVFIPPDLAPFDRLFRAISTLLEAELTTSQFDRDAVERRVAEIIVIQLLRFELASLRDGLDQGAFSVLRDERILRAVSAAHDDLSRGWTVQRLADIAGLSRTAFAVRFAAVLGVPPLQYLNRMRMQRSLTLLNGGRRTLLDVAQAVGYRSEAAFIRAFSRHFGTSPGRWRQAHL